MCFFFCSTWFVCFQLWFGSRFGRLNVRLVDCLSWLAGDPCLLACALTGPHVMHGIDSYFAFTLQAWKKGPCFRHCHFTRDLEEHVIFCLGREQFFSFLETLKEWTMSGKSVCARGKLRMIRCYYMHGLPQSTDN